MALAPIARFTFPHRGYCPIAGRMEESELLQQCFHCLLPADCIVGACTGWIVAWHVDNRGVWILKLASWGLDDTIHGKFRLHLGDYERIFEPCAAFTWHNCLPPDHLIIDNTSIIIERYFTF